MDKNSPIINVIQRLRDKTLDPKLIDPGTRRNCVEVLCFNGVLVHEIAGMFQTCDKTIRRDLAAIRKRNAVAPDPDLTKELVGETLVQVRHNISILQRLAQGKEGSVSERSHAAHSIGKLSLDLLSKMQAVGFLSLETKDKALSDDVVKINVMPVPALPRKEE